MDFVAVRIRRESMLMVMVIIVAVVANLPADVLQSAGIDRRWMMAVLGLVVMIALFLYLKVFVFLLCILLAVGANLPDQWADGLGISKLPLLVALAIMVIGSLLNYGTKAVPMGLEPPPRKKSVESTNALIQAIEKNQTYKLKTILGMGFDPNVPNDQGESPLHVAAARGDLIVAGLLLKNGADPDLPRRDGTTPMQLAVKGGHDKVVALLHSAGKAAAVQAAKV